MVDSSLDSRQEEQSNENADDSKRNGVYFSISLSELGRVYDQAATYFITRRPSEALSLLCTAIFPAPVDHGEPLSFGVAEFAPVAGAPRKLRIKMWSLFISCLDALARIEEAGVQVARPTNHRDLVTKVHNGTIWDVVVQHGYRGQKDCVDAEVIISL